MRFITNVFIGSSYEWETATTPAQLLPMVTAKNQGTWISRIFRPGVGVRVRGNRFYFSAALIFLLLSPLQLFADTISMPKKAASSQVEAYLAKKVQQGDAEAARFLSLVKLGTEVLQIESYFVFSNAVEGKEISNFSADSLRSRWHSAISASPEWNQKIAPAAKAKLLEKQKEFKEFFSDSPYELAWLKKVTGDISGAKAALKTIFEDEFAHLMKMKTVYSGIGKVPMYEIELAWDALSPFCTAAERREYEAKMKKVKVNISNLPQVEVFT